MSLIQLGKVTLSSGVESNFKLEADQFIEDNLAGLVALMRQLVGPYSSVEGVPRGGLRLAAALSTFISIAGPHLIVDDVLTTGGSMERLIDERIEWRGYSNVRQPKIIGAVIFARGQCPLGIKAVFQMPECFWTKPRHR